MSPTQATLAPSAPKPAPAVKAVGPLPPPIVPVPPVSQPLRPAQPPAKAGAEPAAVEPNPAPPQGRTYLPLDIACPHQNADLTNCGAAENEPCSWQQPGMAGTYHAERIADAAAASRGSGILPTDQDFDQAVEDSDLV